MVHGDHEIIVVDNNSADGTADWLRSEHPEVKLVHNRYNAGFSSANNQGVEVSTCDTILLLNPDAKLLDNGIERAMNYLRQHPKTLIGPSVLNPDGTHQDSLIPIVKPLTLLAEALFLSYVFKSARKRVKLGTDHGLSGVCLLMRKALYTELKGLDPDLFWMEDMDFSVRAKQLNYDLMQFTTWKIMHHSGQSSKKNYKVSISNQLISKYKFLAKHQKKGRWLSVIFLEIHIILRILLFALLSPFRRIYRLKLIAYFYAHSLFLKYLIRPKTATF